MPVMVDLHGPGVDVRLERIEGIAERRNRERTCRRWGRRWSGGWRLGEYKAWRGGDSGEACGRAEKMTAG